MNGVLKGIRHVFVIWVLICGVSARAEAQCSVVNGGLGYPVVPAGGLVDIRFTVWESSNFPGACTSLTPEYRLSTASFGGASLSWATVVTVTQDPPELVPGFRILNWRFVIQAEANTSGVSRRGYLQLLRFVDSNGVPLNAGTWNFFDQDPLPPDRKPILRYYNPKPTVVDHFYTSNFAEIGCGANGWWYEATIGEVLDQEQPGTLPLYRYWNGVAGDHFYVTNQNEVPAGSDYTFEGWLGFLFQNQTLGTIPLYRWYNGDPAVLDHLYTTDPNERPTGYALEKVVGFVFPPSSQVQCPRSDLTIASVDAVQVVYLPNLVRGKPTAYKVVINATDCNAVRNTAIGAIDVRVFQDGTAYTGYAQPTAFVNANGQCRAELHVNAGTGPDQKGPSTVSVVVNGEASVHEPTWSNNSAQRTVFVTETRALRVMIVPIMGCQGTAHCYRPPGFVDYALDQARQFIRTVYPLAPSRVSVELSSALSPRAFVGRPEKQSVIGSCSFGLSVCTRKATDVDLEELVVFARSIDPAVDRVIGLVDSEYMSWHNLTEQPYGFTYPFANSAIVRSSSGLARNDGVGGTVAHELGHTFGLRNSLIFGEEYRTTQTLVNGYLVEAAKLVQAAKCFMGLGEDVLSVPSLGDTFWIHGHDYLQLMVNLIPSVDPDVLLLTGIFSGNGTIDWSNSLLLANASIGDFQWSNTPADQTYVFRVTDLGGSALSELVQPISFVQALEPWDLQPVTSVPFAVALAFPPGGVAVDVIRDGVVMETLEPRSALLHSAIEAIPNNAFISSTDQRKNALHRKANAIQTMIEVGAFRGAAQKIVEDLQRAVIGWTASTYEPVGPAEMSKEEILSTLDRLVESLNIVP